MAMSCQLTHWLTWSHLAICPSPYCTHNMRQIYLAFIFAQSCTISISINNHTQISSRILLGLVNEWNPGNNLACFYLRFAICNETFHANSLNYYIEYSENM